MNFLVWSSRSAVIEKSRCCRTRVPANSDSEVFQDPQRYKDYLRHPFLTYVTIGQTSQEIVKVYSNDTFQLKVIRVTTQQALVSRHGFSIQASPKRKSSRVGKFVDSRKVFSISESIVVVEPCSSLSAPEAHWTGEYPPVLQPLM